MNEITTDQQDEDRKKGEEFDKELDILRTKYGYRGVIAVGLIDHGAAIGYTVVYNGELPLEPDKLLERTAEMMREGSIPRQHHN